MGNGCKVKTLSSLHCFSELKTTLAFSVTDFIGFPLERDHTALLSGLTELTRAVMFHSEGSLNPSG